MAQIQLRCQLLGVLETGSPGQSAQSAAEEQLVSSGFGVREPFLTKVGFLPEGHPPPAFKIRKPSGADTGKTGTFRAPEQDCLASV